MLSLNGSSLMLAPNLGLEIVAIHPDSGGTWRHQQDGHHLLRSRRNSMRPSHGER
jgi:hypothetical protein